MTFDSPLALVGLVLVPLAAMAYGLFQRNRPRYGERFASAAMLPNVIDRAPGWRRHLPAAILLLGLGALLVGVARPHAMITVKRENATVVLAVDTSRSMSAVDVRPSRLAAVKVAAARFVAQLPTKYRIGVVDFSTKAEVAVPATRDRTLVQQALSKLAPGGGTALGDGILTALNVGRAVPHERGGEPREVPPVSVLVFTDGLQDGGEVTAEQAVNRARAVKIPVSGVLVGTAYGIVRVPRIGGFVQFIRVPADSSELRNIAKATHGHFYLGPRTADLTPVYSELRSRVGTTKKRMELTFAFALGAIGFLVVGGSLSAVWLRRLP
jgi:Ca-activated chloride channel family protein